MAGAILSVFLLGTLSSVAVQAFQGRMTIQIPRAHSRLHSSSSSSEALSPTAPTPSKGGIRGVVFDIDGTLADSWNLGYQATLTVLTDYHNTKSEEKLTPETYPLTSEEYHYGCRFTTPERLARHVGLEPGNALFEEVGEELGKQFDDYYVQLVDKKTAGFYDGIGELLIKMHSGSLIRLDGGNSADGIKIGALTNACVEYAHAVLKANCPGQVADMSSETDDNDSGIYHRFSSIHGANSVPRPKPFGDGIKLCCSEMGLQPSEVIYVGDAPTDAKAAVDANCRAAIGVLWGSNDEECLSKEKGFNTLCSDVSELENAIRKYL